MPSDDPRPLQIDCGDVTSIETPPYHGFIGASPVGFVPGIGQIRMVRVRTQDGRAHDFPSTVGRRRTVNRIAATLRNVVAVWA
jgi:hypothetical protein